jgi:hypothetical protein
MIPMAVVWQFGEKDKGLIAHLPPADKPVFESLFASKAKDLDQRFRAWGSIEQQVKLNFKNERRVGNGRDD